VCGTHHRWAGFLTASSTPSASLSPADSDAVVSWWVVDEHHRRELERALDQLIPRWLADTWGFRAVHYFP
jgi:hypothetical protein